MNLYNVSLGVLEFNILIKIQEDVDINNTCINGFQYYDIILFLINSNLILKPDYKYNITSLSLESTRTTFGEYTLIQSELYLTLKSFLSGRKFTAQIFTKKKEIKTHNFVITEFLKLIKKSDEKCKTLH